MTSTLTTHTDPCPGEDRSTGISVRNGGTVFCALTLSESRSFKTYKGAAAWLARRGYDANGKRLD
jgi:hypothetical protein